MLKEYKSLYNKHIVDPAKAIIIKYDNADHTYTYKPFSHKSDVNSLNELSDLIIDNTVFYAFSEDEILKMDKNFNILNDLRTAAAYSFKNRLPKSFNESSDGTLGEVLLDLLIQIYEPHSEKLIARAKYTEINSKTEITGYDALYFTKSTNNISLWLGQAKAGAESYCKSGIKEDLTTKYSISYFSDMVFYIATRSESAELSGIIDEINALCFNSLQKKYSPKKKN
jgi:hypothetical protein